uniref:UBZ3-type domain-containing protein n=1 Tax=Rhizophora mucronata TaxID=61149 RepID=A0A2P2Q3U8_RHIMU
MSHFNEDKADAPSDPTQKSLTKYLVADVSGKPLDDQNSLGSDVSAQKFMNDVETSFSVDSHKMHHYERDPLDGSDLQDPNDPSSIICDIKKVYKPLSNRSAEKMDNADLMGSNPVVEFCQTNLSPLTEADSLTGQVERSRPDSVIIMHDQVVSPSEQKDQLFWVDDYKCSLCGIEMPPDFTVERQEHSDYHLAKRLQKEESSVNPKSNNPMMRQRCLQKDHISSQGRHKRIKPSPKDRKHLSIDMFFAKSSQNF